MAMRPGTGAKSQKIDVSLKVASLQYTNAIRIRTPAVTSAYSIQSCSRARCARKSLLLCDVAWLLCNGLRNAIVGLGRGWC